MESFSYLQFDVRWRESLTHPSRPSNQAEGTGFDPRDFHNVDLVHRLR